MSNGFEPFLKLIYFVHHIFTLVSGGRDSNPRPLPWQGSILPAELPPHVFVPRVRVELTSEVFQPPAVTTLAISAIFYYVRLDGIEPSASILPARRTTSALAWIRTKDPYFIRVVLYR